MNRDQKFFDMYSLVIGALVIFAILIYVLVMKLSNVTQGVYTIRVSVGSYRSV